MNIAFLHPDLGLGGAERVVVDAASQLQRAGHRVTIFTAHHDPSHAFDETRDGTLDVRRRGRLLPRQIVQRLRAPLAILRMGWLSIVAARETPDVDLVFCDLVSHAIPLLRRLTRASVVFYCHYPDRLLAPPRGTPYRWYRAPIDRLEEAGLRQAHAVVVNSRFTAGEFNRAFPRLGNLRREVLYPGVEEVADTATPAGDGTATILCISRFDASKNLPLAVDALAALRDRLPADRFARLRLTIAGGFDAGLRECQELWNRLQHRITALALDGAVTLLRSPTDEERRSLLARCWCVVYTPENEHFGLVPLEAMAAGKPVVAVDSGGVRETVESGVTGLLCAPTPEAFAAALQRLDEQPDAAGAMGRAGRARVHAHFSRTRFGQRLDAIVRELVEGRRPAADHA